MKVILEVLNPKFAYMNPFVSQLVTSLEPNGWRVTYWTYLTAFFSRYDVVHVHWPEHLYKGRTATRSLVRLVLLAFLIVRWRFKQIPVVWTVHNLSPHEELSTTERIADKLFRRSVSTSVYLNNYSDVAPGLKRTTRRAVIKHGDYVDWMAAYEKSSSVEKHALLFGALRPYKGAEGLIEAFRSLPDEYSLTIAGKPLDSTYESDLRNLIDGDKKIGFYPGFHEDKDLVKMVSQSSLVVLPYKHMYNSGAVFLALSLNRPVLVPTNPHTSLLQQEFGSYWVRLYEGEISTATLKTNLDQCNEPLIDYPSFEDRRWPLLGQQYATVFSQNY